MIGLQQETGFLRFGLRTVKDVETRFLFALSSLQFLARARQSLHRPIGDLDRRRP